MTREEQLKIYQETHDKIMSIAVSKGQDYANEDVLSNFKSISAAANQLKINISTPTGYAMFMVLLKLGRLANLLNSNKTPNNESIADSFLDGISYLKLAYICYLEASKEEKPIEIDFEQLKKDALSQGHFEQAANIRDFEKRLMEVLAK